MYRSISKKHMNDYEIREAICYYTENIHSEKFRIIDELVIGDARMVKIIVNKFPAIFLLHPPRFDLHTMSVRPVKPLSRPEDDCSRCRSA